jgi:hypothetical protein
MFSWLYTRIVRANKENNDKEKFGKREDLYRKELGRGPNCLFG